MDKKDSFSLYRTTLETIRELDPQSAQDLVIMLGEYEMDGKAPEKRGTAYATFLSIRPLIDKRNRMAEIGSIGGKKTYGQSNALSTAQSNAQSDALSEGQSNAQTKYRNIEIKKDKKEENTKEEKVPYGEIVEFLNEEAGTHYKPSTEATRKWIRARWNEGFRLDDFKTVITKKTAEWKGSDMEKFLRPETLFGTKFESYLNSTGKKPKPQNRFNNFKQRDYNYDDMERRLLNL